MTERPVVLITGAAGQIGSALCKQFDAAGYSIAAADLNEETLAKRINELQLEEAFPLTLDVTDQESIKRGFASVIEQYGKIDALINNAGIAVFTSFRERTYEEFDRVMKVNAYGTFFCAQEALKHMEAAGKGCIVNIASLYGVVSPDPRIYGDSGRNSSEVYGASKAAVIQMTKYLAVHAKGIRVNAISPGGVFNNQKGFFVQEYEKRTPMGRMAHEDDVANAAVFLCSEEASYITGQNIQVDGGFTLW